MVIRFCLPVQAGTGPESEPDLSSDYRLYSLENQTFNAEEITPSNPYYPDISPLSWDAHDINIWDH